MIAISLSARTLYAELAQRADFGGLTPATVKTRIRRGGRKYLYAREKHGSAQVETYLGPADDPDAAEKAAALRRARGDSNQRREIVQMIKRAGVAGPSKQTGQILEALERAGLFDSGLIVVGTIAFQMYPIIIGHHLANAGMMTNDANFAVASIIDIRGDAELTTVLQRGDPSFAPQNQLKKSALPKRFRAANGFEVEILTPIRSRRDEDPVAVKNIAASATPLHYLEFLIEDAMPAVALYGSGVRVRIPQPERYATHKLIVAAQPERDRAKRAKDLVQAAELIEALARDNPDALAAIMNEAAARGPKWSAAITSSLILLDEQHGLKTRLSAGFATEIEKLSRRRAPARVAGTKKTPAKAAAAKKARKR
ncbi:GSU2403 family nucleotidyltransferase fold protein [Terrarubrum flagellatum]|uniref:GSU2403 family nucleotidyltransferase fold protein n=1 Tax=Terrirubrum flagellatum TaxID=2895980 RepID=UPI0031452BF8